MSRCALLFESIHQVMAAEARLKAQGIDFDLMPIPTEISSDCGMAVEFECKDKKLVLEAISELTSKCKGVYRLENKAFLPIDPDD